MALDKDMENLLEMMARANPPEYPDMGPIKAREFFDTNIPILDVPPVALHQISDIKVDGWQDEKLDARLYLPKAINHDEPMPVLLWFHGGGFTIGSINSYDGVCRTLCAKSDVAVLSVAYRLAPEAKFPTAAMDAMAAYQWLLREAKTLGLDDKKIIIGGDSAGGSLSAVTCLLSREANVPQPLLQLLVYPGTSSGVVPTNAYQQYGEGYKLTSKVIDWFFSQYLNNKDEATDYRFSPLSAVSHADLAPAWIGIAEYDPLADDGRLYADKLNKDGVNAQLVQYDGVIHGFLSMGAALQRTHVLHNDMASVIKKAVQ